MQSRLTVAVLVVFALLNLRLCDAVTFVVEPHKEDCLYDKVAADTTIRGSFQVVYGGFLDIDIKITGEDGEVYYSAEREQEGKFNFKTSKTGLYRFCFSNQMSTLTPKTISFQLDVGASGRALAKQDQLTPLEARMNQLLSYIADVTHTMQYMRVREKAHAATADSTNQRVLWWSFIEMIVLVLMCCWQIYSIRMFFEVKYSV
eukprot:gnl/Spiro4/7223_TR3772_c0_g1_i1.p1 gnl/Spiro4/7223_TR3772_c0_g1~~gnl/Spiro4/7223_TR3772_c0_g1_i1.p1  ORF type:complete len:216 (+),score=65.43 gnl/Spiro4/7223_TR3772_c0_g1_i1:41-649(+)